MAPYAMTRAVHLVRADQHVQPRDLLTKTNGKKKNFVEEIYSYIPGHLFMGFWDVFVRFHYEYRHHTESVIGFLKPDRSETNQPYY